MSKGNEWQTDRKTIISKPEGQASVDRDATLLGVLQEISSSLKLLETHVLQFPVNPSVIDNLTRRNSSDSSKSKIEHLASAKSSALAETFLFDEIEERSNLVRQPRIYEYLISSQELDRCKLASWWPPITFRHTQPTEIIKPPHFGEPICGRYPSMKSRLEWDYYKPVVNYRVWRRAINDSSNEKFHDSLCLPATGKGRPNFDIISRSSEIFHEEFYIPYSGTPPIDLIQRALSTEKESTLMSHLGGLLTVPPDHRLDIIFQNHKIKRLVLEDGMVDNMFQMLSQLHAIGGLFEITDMDARGNHFTYKFSQAIHPCDVEEWILDIPCTKARMRSRFGLEFSRNCLPWNRIVLIKGLSHMQPSHILTACPWSYPARMHLNREQLECQSQVYQLHTQCSLSGYELSGHGNVFHITWMKLQTYLGEVLTPEHKAWKRKPLLMDSRKSIGTLCASLEVLPDMQASWCTLLVLLPVSVQHDFLDDIFNHGDYPIVHMVIALILQVMLQASDSWVEIATYLGKLLMVEGDNVAVIEDHEFSQSQKLFQIINQVDELLPTVEDTQTQWAWFKDMNKLPFAIDEIFSVRGGRMKGQDESAYFGRDEVYQEILSKKLKECKDRLRRIDELDQRIRNSGEHLKAIRERARSLRDGIANLTSVKETRETRILAENVKILTYVTIFYLPIALCTSMYAINNMFDTGIRGYAISATIISLGTYAVVFSLTYPSKKLVKPCVGLTDNSQRLTQSGVVDAVLKAVGVGKRINSADQPEVTLKQGIVRQGAIRVYKVWMDFSWLRRKKDAADYELGIPIERDPSFTRGH